MPDVLKIAIARREILLKEISALDRFIVTAHDLLAQAARREHARPRNSSRPSTSSRLGETETSAQPDPVVHEEGPRKDKPPASKTEAFLRKIGVGAMHDGDESTAASSEGSTHRPAEGMG
ncbi:MAG: hypothetical protein AAFN27_11735 [Pseudomonadota bacterium]